MSKHAAVLQKALDIAVFAHRDQLQKNGLPYVFHPIAVMHRVASIEAKTVALLHDVLEDSELTVADLVKASFSDVVIEAVVCLTRVEQGSYTNYIERVKNNKLAIEVKLADLEENMNVLRIPRLSAKDLSRVAKYHEAWVYLASLSNQADEYFSHESEVP